ncbi:MAG: tripartite tricarboxylate transporter substrate binding protein [Comamonas sp.]
MQRRHLLAAGLTALPFLAHASTASALLPKTPIRILVGFPPGGGTDVVTRVIAQQLGQRWDRSVVVENKSGAAGVIAAEYAAKQPADGATLLMTNFSNHAVAPSLHPKLGYVVERDFSPIVLVGIVPSLLICRREQEAQTLEAIVKRCQAQPGAVSFGSAGPGSIQHLALEMFQMRAGIKALHTPYRGSAPMLADLLGGQIDYSFETMASATPHVASGKVVAIAQTRAQRAKAQPQIPTLAEVGFPGFDASTWYGLVGPRGMQQALVQAINRDVNEVLRLPAVAEKLVAFGAEDGGGSSARFEAFIASEKAKWAHVIREAKVVV